jgi:alkylation response protein AidB-like acyl-CoA dehydrogenase
VILLDTEEQAALRSAVRDLLARGLSADALWKRMTGELGLTGLAVPEAYGGAGAGLAEIAVAVEETGRVLAPVPYLSTALAGYVLSRAGAAGAGAAGIDVAAAGVGAAGEFLPGIADGSLRAAFVFAGSLAVSGGRVSGSAAHVLDGASADLFIVACGDSLYVVRAGDASVTPVETLDQTRSQAVVEFGSSSAAPVTGCSGGMAEDLFRVLLAVESAGAAAHCLDVTVAYLRTREQFGRALGTFQALRHRCADLAVEVASASATATAAVASAPAGLEVLGPLAKKYCADVFWHVAAEMIQLHGGIGFTWEHSAHRYLKRAKTTQLILGSPAELRRLVAERAALF